MEEFFREALHNSPQQFLWLLAAHQSRRDRIALRAVLSKCPSRSAAALCHALEQHTALAVDAFRNGRDLPVGSFLNGLKTPSPRRKRRRPVSEKQGKNPSVSEGGFELPSQENAVLWPQNGSHSAEEEVVVGAGNAQPRHGVFANLRACSLVAQLGLSHCHKVFQPIDLFTTVQSLHDQLVLLQDDPELQDSIGSLCEVWWRDNLPGRESLIAQSLPFLLSKSLELGRKVDVHRVYAMRDALTLFDFVDESIEDLKHLLIRCVVTPCYLRSAEGRRFIAFLFGLNAQLVKELITIVRSQIPFGRKSILDAYGEILYRAWRIATGPCLEEIQQSCIQAFIEGAIYASNKVLASSIRRVLAGFIAERTQEGVEAMLFRLQEPVLLRALQVANSNVRRNALLLLVDMFPLENPVASKEEKETLLERQFFLLEKLLMDPCPDVRTTAVEVCCRILRLFWEIVPSAVTVRLLSKVVDEVAQDQSSTAVRCAVLQGMMYLLENPQSHELLKVFLQRLAPMLNDAVLSVRIAAADLLLVIKGIRAIQFYKVVGLDILLSLLANDNAAIARRLTRLLIPSYFPSKVPLAEACNRCITLVKRSPEAGARFCEWALLEGAPQKSLIELAKVFTSLVNPSSGQGNPVEKGILLALNRLCKSLACEKEGKLALEGILTKDNLKSMFSCATTSSGRTAVMELASILPLKDVPEIFRHCGHLVMNITGDTLSSATCNEVRAVHAFVLAWDGFDDLMRAIITLLSEESSMAKRQTLRKFKYQSRLAKSYWPKSLKKPGPPKSRKQASERGNEVEGNFINAVAAAWHIENLLAEDDTRRVLLAHGALNELVVGLKSAARRVVHARWTSVSNFMAVSPIRAYAALSMHMVLHEQNDEQIKSGEATNAQANETCMHMRTPIAGSTQKVAITEVTAELVDWVMDMQSLFGTNNLKTAVGSFPTGQEAAKLTRTNGRSQHKESDFHRSSNAVEGASNCDFEIEIFLQKVTVTTTLLRSLVDAFALELVKDCAMIEMCLEFSSKTVVWIIDRLNAYIEWQQMNVGRGAPRQYLKDIITCVRASTSYSAKLLYLSLKNANGKSFPFSELANHLLDLIALSGTWFGPKAAMSFLSSVRLWLPDLLITVSLSVRTGMEDVEKDCAINNSARYKLFGKLAECGSKFSMLWVDSLASAAFQLIRPVESYSNVSSGVASNQRHSHAPMMETPQGTDDNIEVPDAAGKSRVSSFSVDFMNTLSKLLQRGDFMVLEGIINLVLIHTARSLNNHNYSSALGALDVLCTRLLSCKLPQQKGLRVTLNQTTVAIFEELSDHLDSLLKGFSSSTKDFENLSIAKELLTTVLLLYRV